MLHDRLIVCCPLVSERWPRGGDWHPLRDYGGLYVYQVGDWYEADLELTA
jgi:hypothetical protein